MNKLEKQLTLSEAVHLEVHRLSQRFAEEACRIVEEGRCPSALQEIFYARWDAYLQEN